MSELEWEESLSLVEDVQRKKKKKKNSIKSMLMIKTKYEKSWYYSSR